MRLLQDKLVQNLLKIGFTSNEETHIFLIAHNTTFFCFFTHLILAIVFLAFGHTFFLVVNCFSMITYSIVYLLLNRKKYITVTLLISAEICTYSTVFLFSAGMDTGTASYYILIIMLLWIMPCGTNWARTILLSIALFLSFSMSLYCLHRAPPFVFEEPLKTILLALNLFVLYLGIITQVQQEKIAHLVISQYNEARFKQLHTMATTDTLTGLFNRRYAETFFSNTFSAYNGAYSCIAMADIDNFKQVNDQYGHEVGDRVLQELSTILQENLRKTDIIFRWGGEEFLIVLSDLTLETAQGVLEKLKDAIASHAVPTPKGPVHISVTIGLSKFDAHHHNESIAICDEKMYWGKKNGKNQVIV